MDEPSQSDPEIEDSRIINRLHVARVAAEDAAEAFEAATRELEALLKKRRLERE